MHRNKKNKFAGNTYRYFKLTPHRAFDSLFKKTRGQTSTPPKTNIATE